MSIKFEIPSTANHTVTGTFTLDGYVINPSNATTGQVLKYNGSSFVAADETGGGGSIGASVGSSTPKSVLFINALGQLAQDNTNLFYEYGPGDSALQLRVYGLDSISGSDPLRLGTVVASEINIGRNGIDTNLDGNVIVDGYQIDPSSATLNQVLQYDGYAFVPRTVSSMWLGMFWSPCLIAQATATPVSTYNATTGRTFSFDTTVTILGMKFWWSGGVGALTIKCQIWDPSLVSLQIQTVSVNAAGIYIATWNTPVVVATTASPYLFSMWETTGTYYMGTAGLTNPETVSSTINAMLVGHHIMLAQIGSYSNFYSNGDAAPTTPHPGTPTAHYFAIEPVLQ